MPVAPLQNTDCDGCYLYRKYSQPATSGDFVSNHDDVSKNDHVLVMPRAGCAGVESWATGYCGYEGAWDHAWSLLTTGELKAQKAFAINSMHRRTQHQVRRLMCCLPVCHEGPAVAGRQQQGSRRVPAESSPPPLASPSRPRRRCTSTWPTSTPR